MNTRCYACDSVYDASRVRCDCGEPVWFDVDATAFAWPMGDTRRVWRYADLLPVDPANGLGWAAGGTPLLRLDRLDEYAGCRVWVKDETANPTGTFKDRGSAVAVAAVAERGGRHIGTVSHGNMAMSTAAHAAACGLECVVLVPKDISEKRLAAIGQYRPTIVRVDGDYGQLYYDSLDIGREFSIEFVNSDVPLRVAGQKTVALEIVERFDGVPDAICLPVSSGGQASGVWKALRELETAGLIESVPRLYFVQAANCDPIAQAYEAGHDVERIEPKSTAAYSIANANPPSGNRVLAAAAETDGAVLSVSEDAISEATRRFAELAGLCVEPSSAVALAGLHDLTAAGELDEDESVALILTGTGFKELSRDFADSPIVPLSGLHEYFESALGAHL
ncbi:threonine synthase [Haladaptatus sp. GCM10025707]|uniref:threonine synthase n=1 Tax=unclassified Haladaptatus TaxID=2622732 RepID=UPI0023E82586|nr:threonine synthase [Haladaptatus sp. QDMS2]